MKTILIIIVCLLAIAALVFAVKLALDELNRST